MNWPEEPAESAVEAAAAEHADASTLFPGDTGALSFDARRVLCQLLAGPSVDAERHARLWPALLREERAIRARLNELFLELILDRDLRIAFVRQTDTGELESPTLLRTHPLTFIDSVLLLHLRQRLAEAEAHGQRAAVEEAGLHAQMSVYEPAHGTDHAGFTKKVNSAVEKMKKNSVLQPIRGSEGRLEVSPVLRLLFSAEDVQALGEVYRAQLAGLYHDAADAAEGEEA